MSTPAASLQDQFFPEGECFGCGPRNTAGLRLRSFANGAGAIAEWTPRNIHQAVPGVLCGGIVSTLLDCHTGAALAHAVHGRTGKWPFLEDAPWATAKLDLELVRPTSLALPVTLRAHVTEIGDDEATVEAELHSDGRLRARCCAHWRKVVRR